MSVYSQGGHHKHEIGDLVDWHGRVGRVIALSTQPSVTIKFDSGEHLTVGQSALSPSDSRSDRG